MASTSGGFNSTLALLCSCYRVPSLGNPEQEMASTCHMTVIQRLHGACTTALLKVSGQNGNEYGMERRVYKSLVCVYAQHFLTRLPAAAGVPKPGEELGLHSSRNPRGSLTPLTLHVWNVFAKGVPVAELAREVHQAL
ncbi:hypothetical protein VULLAG_LOCUS12747 [Vulpes lagopus]